MVQDSLKAQPQGAEFLNSMTFAKHQCGEMGCNQSHHLSALKRRPANDQTFPVSVLPWGNEDFCLPVALPEKGSEAVRPPNITEAATLLSLDDALAHAVDVTKKRLRDLNKNTPTSLGSPAQARAIARKERLESRLKDFEAIPLFLKEKNLTFKGFKGWDETNASRVAEKTGMSQFDSVLAETADGKTHHFPLDSRIRQLKGIEVDLINRPIAHNDHFHDAWVRQSLQSYLSSSIKWEIGLDAEGCPCCVAGLDFDEPAAAVKEILKSNSHNNALTGVADLNSAAHWGLVLGAVAPFGLIGLAAALRNIKGTSSTLGNLKALIAGLDDDIQRLDSKGFHADVLKLKAFRNTLFYSRYDSKFNLMVPGVVNGVASTLVLTSAFLAHPFALPVIALYATGQLARNVGDLAQASVRRTQVVAQASPSLQQAQKKVNQIERSKTRFYAANTAGFATFATGAMLTFLSIPAFSLFGSGALFLPLGLALLAAGAVSTGVMNNIWPKRFKPRNGHLGQPRESWENPDAVLLQISKLQNLKKAIQETKPAVVPNQTMRRFGLKILTAMPEFKDFMPARWANRVARFNSRWLSFLPPVGTQATRRKHQLNKDTAYALHHNQTQSNQVVCERIKMLEKMVNAQAGSTQITDEHNAKKLAKHSWDLLVQLNCHADMVQLGFQENFLVPAQGKEFPGLNFESETWGKFNFVDFITKCTDEQLRGFNVAIDFFLFFRLPKLIRYQQYGLNDFYWRWRRQIHLSMTNSKFQNGQRAEV